MKYRMSAEKYKALLGPNKILRKKTEPGRLLSYDKNYFSFTQE